MIMKDQIRLPLCVNYRFCCVLSVNKCRQACFSKQSPSLRVSKKKTFLVLYFNFKKSLCELAY